MRASSPVSGKIELDILLKLIARSGSGHLNFTRRQLEIFTTQNIRFDWLSKKFMVSFFAEGDDVKEKADLERNLNEILKVALQPDIEIAKPVAWTPPDVEALDRVIIAYSPKRIIFDGYSKERDFMDVMLSVLNACLMDSFLERSLSKTVKSGDRAFHTLPSKPLEFKAAGVYLRDDFAEIGGIVHQPHPKILKHYKGKKKDAPDDLMAISRTHEACLEDLREDGVKDFAYVPFMLEGGNILVGKNKKGEDVIIIAPSDREFGDDKSFEGGFFLEDDGSVSKNSYEDFCRKVKAWCESKGYKSVVLERNLAEYSLREVYHADILVGLTNDGTVIVPDQEKDKAEPPISTKSLRELERVFGEENMIFCSAKDRESLATNFIQVGNIAFLSSNSISKPFIKELNDRGICAVIPPRRMSIFGDDGIRCHTNVIAKSEEIERKRKYKDENTYTAPH